MWNSLFDQHSYLLVSRSSRSFSSWSCFDFFFSSLCLLFSSLSFCFSSALRSRLILSIRVLILKLRTRLTGHRWLGTFARPAPPSFISSSLPARLSPSPPRSSDSSSSSSAMGFFLGLPLGRFSFSFSVSFSFSFLPLLLPRPFLFSISSSSSSSSSSWSLLALDASSPGILERKD